MISKGYAEANLKTLKSYDPSTPVSYIIYLDANNLYEHSMMKLPFGILDWIHPEKINLGNFHKDGSIGCFLEVDLDYADELHDLDDVSPVSGKYIKVAKEMPSDFHLKIKRNNNFFHGKNKKLISNLGNKRKHKLHYQDLKLFLELGLIVKKNYRVLKFTENAFSKPYIKHKTELQIEAEKEDNKDKKQNSKLRNNAIHGKSI